MSNTVHPIVEIAVYTVHDAAEGRRARDQAHLHMQHVQGFISWDRLVSGDDPAQFVDVVQWASHDAAKGGADLVRSDARFAPFVAAIDKIVVFHHYDRQF
jgi:hypothetical protein